MTKVDVRLQEFVKKADEIYAESYAAFNSFVNSYVYPIQRSSDDPFSPAYRKSVIDSYLSVTGLSFYDPAANELSNFQEVPYAPRAQFPYSMGEALAVGNYLVGVGLVMQHVSVPAAGSYIIEYGPGWGHLTTSLGQAGYDIAAIDIEPAFVDLINDRATKMDLPVKAYVGKFGDRPDGDRLVDAVIFLESFHHSLEHVDVLKKIYSWLKVGGEVIFGAEAIYPDFDCPWGIRRDGHAIWAVHKLKWMELGFSEDYFSKLMIRLGFSLSKTKIDNVGPFGLVYKAVKSNYIDLTNTLLPSNEISTWAPRGEDNVLFAGSESILSVADFSFSGEMVVTAKNFLSKPLKAIFSFNGKDFPVSVAVNSTVKIVIPISSGSGLLEVSSETLCPAECGVGDDRRMLGIAVLSIEYS